MPHLADQSLEPGEVMSVTSGEVQVTSSNPLPISDLNVAHYGLVTADPTSPPSRLPALGWMSVAVGVLTVAAAVLSSVLFARSMIERTEYTSSPPCVAEPTGDCWIESEATVVGKSVEARSVLVDDHVLQLNEVGGPEVTLADGRGLWDALQPGDTVTLRHWHGDIVHVSAEGQQADAVDNPRVGAQRLYAASIGTLGLGALLVLAGFGWVSLQTGPRRTARPVHPVLTWVARVAFAAVCVGATGLAAEVYTRAAPLPVVTLLGVAVVAALGFVVRVARTRFLHRRVAL